MTRTLLWLSILLDGLIIAGLATKVASAGLSGLWAWFRHVHLVSVSVTNGQAIYQLQPDYRFTALYITVILGAFALTLFALRMYMRNHNFRS